MLTRQTGECSRSSTERSGLALCPVLLTHQTPLCIFYFLHIYIVNCLYFQAILAASHCTMALVILLGEIITGTTAAKELIIIRAQGLRHSYGKGKLRVLLPLLHLQWSSLLIRTWSVPSSVSALTTHENIVFGRSHTFLGSFHRLNLFLPSS